MYICIHKCQHHGSKEEARQHVQAGEHGRVREAALVHEPYHYVLDIVLLITAT